MASMKTLRRVKHRSEIARMKRNRPGKPQRSKTPQVVAILPTQSGISASTLAVAISGDWLPVEQLHEKALAATREGGDVVLNLGGVDHLDASAFQILLALSIEQKKLGRELRCEDASASLKHSFKIAGANQHLFANEDVGQ
jgi:anti-anti-sigma regulatory factor